MITELIKIGKIIGKREGFENKLKSKYDKEDKVIIFEDGQIEETILYDIKEQFAYVGGNPSPVGSHGIGGVTPFLFQLSKLTKQKILKSERFVEIYNKIKNENEDRWLVGSLMDWMYENERWIRLVYRGEIDCKWNYMNNLLKDKFHRDKKEKVEWIFIKRFKSESSNELYERYIDAWIEKSKRKKTVKHIKDKCGFCGKENAEIVYPRLDFLTIDKGTYQDNMRSNKVMQMKRRICSECDAYASSAWRYLNNIFGGKFILLPRFKNDMSEMNRKDMLNGFRKIGDENTRKFDILNNIIKTEFSGVNFDMLITEKEQQATSIRKVIRDYKGHRNNRFKADDGFYYELSTDGELKYVFFESKSKYLVERINNNMDLEQILKTFLTDGEKNMGPQKSFHFYKLYNKPNTSDWTGKPIGPSLKRKMLRYRDELNSFIYSGKNLNKKVLDSICIDSINYILNGDSDYKPENIMEILNYYYFLLCNYGGMKKMSTKKEKVNELKYLFEQMYNGHIELDDFEEQCGYILDEDRDMVYYLLGQYMKKIDNTRGIDSKNALFPSIIQGRNGRLIKKNFVKIEQNLADMINARNRKFKMVHTLLKNVDGLFEDDISDIVFNMCNGYYDGMDILKREAGEKDE